MDMGHSLRQRSPSLFTQCEDYITFAENVHISCKMQPDHMGRNLALGFNSMFLSFL